MGTLSGCRRDAAVRVRRRPRSRRGLTPGQFVEELQAASGVAVAPSPRGEPGVVRAVDLDEALRDRNQRTRCKMAIDQALPAVRKIRSGDGAEKQVWVAGGIGITPFISVLRTMAPGHGKTVRLYWCVRTEREALFLDELDVRAVKNWRDDYAVRLGSRGTARCGCDRERSGWRGRGLELLSLRAEASGGSGHAPPADPYRGVRVPVTGPATVVRRCRRVLSRDPSHGHHSSFT